MLSIIIPTLNEEKYLPQLLKSIKRQNFRDYEIIVADAGSEDKTVEIAKNYGCKISKGGLPGKGRNEGAKIAKGDLLLFLDADVILPSQFLEKFLNEFKRKNLDIASCFILPKGGKRIDKIFFSFYNQLGRLTQKFLPHAAIVILVKKSIHHKIGGFDTRIKLAEDHYYARTAKRQVGANFGFLKIGPVFTSPRRVERDGRFKTYSKYFLCELYMSFLGPVKSDIFKYKFNHYNK